MALCTRDRNVTPQKQVEWLPGDGKLGKARPKKVLVVNSRPSGLLSVFHKSTQQDIRVRPNKNPPHKDWSSKLDINLNTGIDDKDARVYQSGWEGLSLYTSSN
jgi:hypothetical protein